MRNTTRSSHPQQKGFSLIELMIVIAVIGLLASFAWPAYQEHVHKARRAEGQIALLELSQFLERFYTANGRYDQDRNGEDVTLPYTEAPRDGGSTKYYDLDFADGFPTTSAYTLQAIPKGVMASDMCGTLTLTHRGEKSQSNGTLSQCWRR